MFFFHLFGAFNFYQTTHRNPSVATLPDAMDATSSATSVARRNDWGWWKILAKNGKMGMVVDSPY